MLAFANVTYFVRLLFGIMHLTSSNLQFVQGMPCSTTSQRTLRERQHWQAFDALLLRLWDGCMPLSGTIRSKACDWTFLVSGGDTTDKQEKLRSIGPKIDVGRRNPVQGVFGAT